MPSSEDIKSKENIFSVGEMQLKTLEKTEENTLYILQLRQMIQMQQKEIEGLKGQINRMAQKTNQ